MTVQMIITAVLIVLGLLFMLASLIGIARFPDFFARLHAQGVGDTLGAFLIIAGMAAATGAGLLSVKLLLIFVIIVLTNPIGTNLMMIAAINKEDYQGYSTLMSGRKKTVAAGDSAETEKTAAPESAETDKTAAPGSEAKEKKAVQGSETQEKKEVSGSEAENRNTGSKENRKNNAGRSSRKDGRQGGRRRKPSMNMNKAELIEAAKERGIDVPEEATKREILGLIYSGDDRNHR